MSPEFGVRLEAAGRGDLGSLKGISVEYLQDGEPHSLAIDALFVFCGDTGPFAAELATYCENYRKTWPTPGPTELP